MFSTNKLNLIDELVFADLVNLYCREFDNWSLYEGIPKHDTTLAKFMEHARHKLYLRIDFGNSDFFIPLKYFSDTGWHQFHFPAFIRDQQTQEVQEARSDDFFQLAVNQVAEQGLIDSNQFNLGEFETNFYKKWKKARIAKLDESDEYDIKKIPLKYLESTNRLEWKMPLIESLILASSILQHTEIRQATLSWFEKYFEATFPALILSIQTRNINFQDTILRLDGKLNPHKLIIYSKTVNSAPSTDFDHVKNQFIEDFLIGNVFRLISLAGNRNLCKERDVLKILYKYLKTEEDNDDTGLITYILSARFLDIKGSLFAEITPYRRKIPNLLHLAFLSETLIHPNNFEPVFSRAFNTEGIVIHLRPFNIDEDLELVHEWFHRDHAKVIWKMDWSLKELELFYRTMLPGNLAHSYIGEINGEPTFNFEVYRASRDIVGNYFDVLPGDYGTHLFIAPTEKHKKYPSQTMQTIMDWLFAQPEVGRLVGEGSIESLPALMNKLHVGFRLQGIIEMPHKKANLNFCYREWYWEKFPENKLSNYESDPFITH